MLNVAVNVKGSDGYEDTREVHIPSVSNEVAVLLTTDHPLTDEHEKLIDDAIWPHIQNHLERYRYVLGDEDFEVNYETIVDDKRTVN